MGSFRMVQKAMFLAFLMLIIPTMALAEGCGEEGEEDHNRKEALKYKLAAIFAIFTASTIGVCIPLLGRTIPALSPERDIFFVIKAFAAGVILATGFIHVLPDAFEDLSSDCLGKPWVDFPFTGFVAMLSAIGTLMVDTYATSYYMKKSKDNVTGGSEEGIIPVHSHAGHSHGAVAYIDGGSELLRHRVISQVLELGIIVHSVIIGIALGASESPSTIRPLVAALTFHQFFEGIGLGGCITQAKFKTRAVIVMTLFFSLTTSVGIGIGIGIINRYDENSSSALIVQGVFNSASAGILIYMALVDLLAADFMSPRLQTNKKLQLFAHASLLIGAGCMSLLAKWA